jgi:hypothetical protein
MYFLNIATHRRRYEKKREYFQPNIKIIIIKLRSEFQQIFWNLYERHRPNHPK